MSQSEKTSNQRTCPQCGAELPEGLPAEFCPKCLLQAGLSTRPAPRPDGSAVLPAAQAQSRGLPQPGELFGHYRIIRLLGEGGMGAAFEADDLETGRRVALKVLSHKLDSPEARERFFREGRLAASINHPNSVYVFGTEEIGGTPAIAMELVSGGTLQNRLDARGPLPIGEAVDAALQIITGLEAAQRIGILHRDVKPSNCFRDADGTVKIGDFGLSISTAVRTEPALTAAGAFLGTPAFCSPEQLRGDELNARSDMYSVGATLFYLLTGRTPFEAKNMVQLLATVLEQRAPSPVKFRADIPRGLARVILRCLEKQPGERFKTYHELARALAPYSSAAPSPATMGLRFLAGALDVMLATLLNMLLWVPLFGSPMAFMDPSFMASSRAIPWMIEGVVFSILYYAVLESRWGATLGKAICRLRVIGPGNQPPGFARALARAAIYVIVPMLPYGLIFVGNPRAYFESSQTIQMLAGFSYYFALALLFCTVRRRNGFAALHELATKTRVISRVAFLSRPMLATTETPPAALETQRLIGPYHVLETLAKSAELEWLLGYDLRLLRKVWIRLVPPETPPVPAALRNIGRVGRLRWLAGKRTPEENWDAFEAASGGPLLRVVEGPQPWSRVRFWLYDLAQELGAAEKDNTFPPVLALDRGWITADGRAKLLDFPALTSHTLESKAATFREDRRPQEFLAEVASAALSSQRSSGSVQAIARPLPLHARQFVKSLPQLLNAGAAAVAIKPLLHRAAEVTRWRRAAIVAGCLAFPLLACLGMIFGMGLLERWHQSNPGIMELSSLLQQRRMGIFKKLPNGPTDRQFSVYLATHYRSTITNETLWTGPYAAAIIKGDDRRFLERSLAESSEATPAEVAEAETAMKPIKVHTGGFQLARQPWFPLIVVAVSLLIYVAFPALIAALAFRGGLVLLIAGVTYVRRDGEWASRLRILWRSLLAWAPPALGLVLATMLKPWTGAFGGALLALLLVGGLAILSVALPGRGLQDRLAGTWPVPR